jgi:hypothetical protein
MMKKSILAVAIATFLTGCGGVDESEPTRTETPPTNSNPTGDTTPARLDVNGPSNVNERDNATAKAVVEFTLNRDATSDLEIFYSVQSAESGSVTATPGKDFTEVENASVEITVGQRRASIEVDILGDLIDEDNETIVVSINDVQGAEVDYIKTSTFFEIIDNDPEPEVVFDIPQQIVSEKTGGIEIGLSLTSITEKVVTVPIEFTGTANEEQDFEKQFSDTIEFAPLQDKQTLALTVIDDAIPEGGESLTLTLGDITNSAAGDQDSHTVIISGQVGLNDTGVLLYSDGVNLDYQETPDGFPGQDAASGRDVTVNNSVDGFAGFAFEYLDADGNVIGEGSRDEASAEGAVCVRDRTTNLTWEIKQEQHVDLISGDDNVNRAFQSSNQDYYDDFADEHSFWRSANYQYTWYVLDEENNAGVIGARGEQLVNSLPISSSCAYQSSELHNLSGVTDTQILPQLLGVGRGAVHCNTNDYLREMQRASLCGFTDWRLPTLNEMKSVVVYETQTAINGEEVSVIPSMFPRDAAIEKGNQVFSVYRDRIEQSPITRPFYFTSTPSTENDGSVWCVNTETGDTALCLKNRTGYIRGVRGGSE